MTDLPIIFSAPMVLALLAGRKTQTRRLAWKMDCGNRVQWKASPWQKVKAGDRLWVRENFLIKPWFGAGRNKMVGIECLVGDDSPRCCWHSRPGDADRYLKRTAPQPSIHMPRWASRITLIVEAVKVEPLTSIAEQDAGAEGVTEYCVPPGAHPHLGRCRHCGQVRQQHVGTVKCCFGGMGTIFSPGTLAGGFAALWETLHGAGAWEANPEVVALTFRVVKENIDRIKEAA